MNEREFREEGVAVERFCELRNAVRVFLGSYHLLTKFATTSPEKEMALEKIVEELQIEMEKPFP